MVPDSESTSCQRLRMGPQHRPPGMLFDHSVFRGGLRSRVEACDPLRHGLRLWEVSNAFTLLCLESGCICND